MLGPSRPGQAWVSETLREGARGRAAAAVYNRDFRDRRVNLKVTVCLELQGQLDSEPPGPAARPGPGPGSRVLLSPWHSLRLALTVTGNPSHWHRRGTVIAESSR